MKYLVGIDGGTQSTKIGIFNIKGELLFEEKVQLKPLYSPDADTAEHPDDDLWDSLKYVSNKLMQKFDADPKDIVGIGLGSIRSCRVYMKKDGNLAMPVLNWMDKRLIKPATTSVKNMQYACATTGYLTVKMTGEFKDTVANAEEQYGPLDRVNWKWSENEDDYKNNDTQKENLLELVMPGDLLGYVTEKAAKETGFPKGCPVYATENDKAAEALGYGVKNDGGCLISLGTYIGAMMSGEEYRDDVSGYWTNFSGVPYEYLYETAGIRRGMWSVSWFKELIGDGLVEKAEKLGISPEELLESEARLIDAGSGGLIAVPEFMAPNDKLYRKAYFIGFDGRHKRAHMYRSILESIAMTMKINVDAMINERGVDLNYVLVSGGGSNSPLFMQIIADVFGKKSVRNKVNNAAGLGAAINVAVGSGIYKNYDEAILNMVHKKDEFEPNFENTKIYDKIIDILSDIKDYTDPINKKIYDIFG